MSLIRVKDLDIFDDNSHIIGSNGDCGSNEGEGLSMQRLCDHKMVELEGVTTVLKDGSQARNVSKRKMHKSTVRGIVMKLLGNLKIFYNQVFVSENVKIISKSKCTICVVFIRQCNERFFNKTNDFKL